MLHSPVATSCERAASFPCENGGALTRLRHRIPNVTFCVLTYGDHPRLAQRAPESIRSHCPQAQYRLIVGANAVSVETEAYLKSLQAKGEIDQLIVSPVNLNKCP